MKTKILFLFVHLDYGGAEVGLLTTLKNIDRSKFDCVIVSIEKKGAIGEEIEKLGFRVLYLDDRAGLSNISLIFKIIKILKAEKPDILHTSLFYANFFGRVAAIFKRVPIIITEERSMYTEKKFYHVIIDRLLSLFTDKIIACSNSVLDFTVKQEGIPREKFFLIYNAVDRERFNISESKEDLRAKLGFSKNDFVIGTVGSVIPKKGHINLIKAVLAIKDAAPSCKLLIIGDGEKREELSSFVKSAGLDGRVFFLGPRKDIPQLMKCMDIFVLPSLQEGFPRTLLEAMYSGLCVIASNISGIPELIDDGENGFLIHPGNINSIADKISEVYKNQDLREKIGLAAKKKIELYYKPEDYAKNLENLYLQLMGEK